MEKNKIKIGKIITLGVAGAGLLAMLVGPSALAQTNGTATSTALTTRQQPARGEGRGERMPPIDFRNATVTVAYLNNGTTETFVSTDAAVIAQMKNHVTRINDMAAKKNAANNGTTAKIDVTAVATATGMVITTTSTDADTAARIINQAKIRELEKKLADAKVDIKAATTRTVQNTANGVTITISSDNPDVAQLIQLREKYQPQGPGPGMGMGMGMERGDRPMMPWGGEMKGRPGRNGQSSAGQEDDGEDNPSADTSAGQNSTL